MSTCHNATLQNLPHCTSARGAFRHLPSMTVMHVSLVVKGTHPQMVLDSIIPERTPVNCDKRLLQPNSLPTTSCIVVAFAITYRMYNLHCLSPMSRLDCGSPSLECTLGPHIVLLSSPLQGIPVNLVGIASSLTSRFTANGSDKGVLTRILDLSADSICA